ncbi:MAG: deoxynucleoside kinase [Myxococcota bacterium]
MSGGGQTLLAIAGNIGSGKTTLTRLVAQRLEIGALYEPSDDNPYLADFYADMARYGLALQLRFLADRVAQVRELRARGASAVQDRTCYEDAEIFARSLHEDGPMDARDWQTYERVAAPLLEDLPAPDLLVYLRRSPESCAERVRLRGRDYERSLPEGYLANLGRRYDLWFESYDRGAKLYLDGDGYDIVDRPEDLQGIVETIRAALPQPLLEFE